MAIQAAVGQLGIVYVRVTGKTVLIQAQESSLRMDRFIRLEFARANISGLMAGAAVALAVRSLERITGKRVVEGFLPLGPVH